MSKRILQVVETAYRATLEEQDDPVLWLSTSLRGAGAEVDVLLRGAAVHYAGRTQNARGLELGAWKQKNPPDLAADLKRLREKGASIFIVEEDATNRAIRREEVVEGLTWVRSNGLPELLRGYDLVWQW